MQRKKTKRHDLSKIREKFRGIVAAAAKRYNELVNSSYDLVPAVYNAERTKSKNAEEVFSIDDKKRFREIQREVRRAKEFLRETESDNYEVLNARYENARSDPHRFGGDFKEAFGESYNTHEVNKEFAETSFAIYHAIESEISRDVAQYDSENLINAIYDMVEEEQGFGDDYVAQKQLQLVDYLREKYLARDAKADKELMHQDSEYGLLEESSSAKDFYLKMADKYWYKPNDWG